MAPRRLRRRRPEVPRRASRHVADDGERRGLGAHSREPGRPAGLLPVDARLEGAVDRRREVPVHALGQRHLRRRGGRRRAARGRAGELDRAPRALGGGVPRRRARDGPRALAAQRRGRVGLRDRDHRPRRPHRRAGARPLPRAVRRDGLRGPGGREPRPHRAHGPVGAVAAPGRRARGARSHLRRPRRARSRSAPGSRLPWPSSPRPSRRSRDLRLAHACRLVRVDVRRLARPRWDRGAHARARDHRRRRLLSRPRVRPRGRRVDPGAVRALLGEPARARAMSRSCASTSTTRSSSA